MQKQNYVCIDIGGSGTKISLMIQNQLTNPVYFENKFIFQNRNQASIRLSNAIYKVYLHYSSLKKINNIVISLTGNIDHKNNILLLSDRLEECQKSGYSYKNYQFAKQLQKTYPNLYNDKIKVTLLNDSITACLDPVYKNKLLLTLILGTYPVISLSQKLLKQNHIKIYRTYTQKWTQITLSNGKKLSQSLNNKEIKKRDDLANCQQIVEAVLKILKQYKLTFNWQPECFVILGGNAHILKHLKQWPKQIKHVIMKVISNHDESTKCQMRGVIQYSKNVQKYLII